MLLHTDESSRNRAKQGRRSSLQVGSRSFPPCPQRIAKLTERIADVPQFVALRAIKPDGQGSSSRSVHQGAQSGGEK